VFIITVHLLLSSLIVV